MTPQKEVENIIKNFNSFMSDLLEEFKTRIGRIDKKKDYIEISNELATEIFDIKSKVYDYINKLHLRPEINNNFILFGEKYGNLDYYKNYNIQLELITHSKNFTKIKIEFENEVFDINENEFTPIHF